MLPVYCIGTFDVRPALFASFVTFCPNPECQSVVMAVLAWLSVATYQPCEELSCG